MHEQSKVAEGSRRLRFVALLLASVELISFARRALRSLTRVTSVQQLSVRLDLCQCDPLQRNHPRVYELGEVLAMHLGNSAVTVIARVRYVGNDPTLSCIQLYSPKFDRHM